MKKKAFQSATIPSTPVPLLRPTEPGVIFFAEVNRHVLAYAPIHFYLRPWCDGRYSRQTLHRMLMNVSEQENWHAQYGAVEHRALHASNCVLVEVLLRQLTGRDEMRVQVAA